MDNNRRGETKVSIEPSPGWRHRTAKGWAWCSGRDGLIQPVTVHSSLAVGHIASRGEPIRPATLPWLPRWMGVWVAAVKTPERRAEGETPSSWISSKSKQAAESGRRRWC
ncbi:hypothetical protein Cob_v012674 [Colletotrichum orbiculare MAFF 240422]|uniref:Uncharacterized protein n=1 Tax=Colletotrichum orbiculare (strain 104-T / ATCC 96160 / CBS 514.97 / LARS 414 / MAFF 240422) TaxID=1213857 RepID=A0A484F829_COLOR|nr:hypothetical protein Cob_v012674 [Colletotrichum orbiculare MAFF 240422]